MSTPEMVEVDAVESPEKLSSNWTRFSRSDRILASLAGVSFMYVNQTMQSNLYGAGVAITFFLLMHMLLEDRVYVQAFGIFPEMWLKLVKKGVLWVRGQPSWFFGSPLIPATPTSIGENFGTVYYKKRWGPGADVFYIAGEGSNFNSYDLRRKIDMLREIGIALRRVAATHPTYKIGLSMLQLRTQHNWPSLISQYNETFHPDYVDEKLAERLSYVGEDRLTPEEKAKLFCGWQCIEDQLRIAQEHCKEVTMVFAITVVRKGALLAASKKNKELSKRDLERSELVKLAKQALDALSAKPCGLVRPRLLSFEEVQDLVRRMWDSYDLGDYYKQRMGLVKVEVKKNDPPPYSPQIKMEVGPNWLLADNTYIRHLRLTQYTDHMLSNDWHAVPQIKVPFMGYACVGDISRITREYRIAKGWNNTVKVFRRDVLKWADDTPDVQEKDRGRSQRLSEMWYSRSTHSWSDYVTVTAADMEELDDNTETAQTALRHMGWNSKPIEGRRRQRKYLVTRIGINPASL